MDSSQQPQQPDPQPTAQNAPQVAQQPTRQTASQPAQQPTQQDASQLAQQAAAQPAQQPGQQPAQQAAPQPAPQPAQQPYQQAPHQAFYQPYQQPVQPAAHPQPAYAPAKQKSHGWIVAIAVVACLCIFGMFTVHSCSSLVSSVSPGLQSTSSLEGLTGDAVAIIRIDGTIQYDGTACSPEGLKALLDEAEENSRVKAVVLRVDSGGGTATAGEEMAEYVRQFAKKKPVVVSSASINASAAYEISSQANYIFVAKSTEIGAIGTAMQLTDLSGLLDMLGIRMDVITSSDEKDSSYGYRPLSEDERAQYQHMVDQINAVFLDNVAEGRHMKIEDVRALATGMPFTGIDAVENGLADEIGTCEDAIDKAAELAGIQDYTTVDLQFSDYDLTSLASMLGESEMSLHDLVEVLKEEGASVRFQ